MSGEPREIVRRLVSGAEIVSEVERRTSDALVVAGEAWSRDGSSFRVLDVATKRMSSAEDALACAAGMAASGLRTAVFVDGTALPSLQPSLQAAARRRLPLVVHCSLPAGHDDYLQIGDDGYVCLVAADAQEAKDLSLIARRIAEDALAPVLCAQDRRHTTEALQSIGLDAEDLAVRYVGLPSDRIAPRTAAQGLLWPEHRRRLPTLASLDQPAGLGGRMDEDTEFQSRAAEEVYFSNAIAPLADKAFDDFAGLTKRQYARIGEYRADDADFVVVAQGAVVPDLAAAVDELRSAGIRAGVLGVRMYRPFPDDILVPLVTGKKAVTVLACSSRTGAARHLAREVRAALQADAESRAEAARNEKRLFSAAPPPPIPAVFEGIYGGGDAHPSIDDLIAVYENMLRGPDAVRSFFVGARFDRPDIRVPMLERQQQLVRRSYADVLRRTVGALGRHDAGTNHRSAIQFRTSSADSASFAASMAARMLFADGRRNVLARPGYDAGHPAASGVQTLVIADSAAPIRGRRPVIDGLVLSSPAFLENRTLRDELASGALIVTDAQGSRDALATRLSGDAVEWIETRELRLVAVDAASVAHEVSDDDLLARALSVPILLGAFFGHLGDVDDFDAFADRYRRLAANTFGEQSALAELHVAAFRAGKEEAAPVDLSARPENLSDEELPVPHPARTAPDGDTALDLSRFWRTTGYLHRLGERNGVIADPHLAVGVMPGRSSSFTADGRLFADLPRLDPKPCTACGTCWTICPEAALSATIRDLDELVTGSLAAAGGTFVHLPRLTGHLSKLAHRIVASDDLHQYDTLDVLLDEAISRLLEQMNPDETQREAVSTEYGRIRSRIEGFPVLRTEQFFDDRERDTKGSGLLFSLTIDPDACKACGLCVEECPEAALEMAPRNRKRIETGRSLGRFASDLPDTSWKRTEAFVDESDDRSLAYHFMHRGVHAARLGGDDGAPGDGKAIALRLLAGAVETIVRPRSEALRSRIETSIDSTEKAIQGAFDRTVRISDLDVLRARLSEIQDEPPDVATLAQMAWETGDEFLPDSRRLKQLADALAGLRTLRERYEGNGIGRASAVAAFDAEPGGSTVPTFPANPYPFPWISFGSAPAAAEGLFEGAMAQMARTFVLLRRAELLLQGDYLPDEHEPFFERFSWRDFTSDEFEACPPVMAVIEHESDGIRAVLRSDLPLNVIRLDRLGEPPEPSLDFLGARHAFILQSSIGHPEHLLKGFLDGIAFSGPAFFHVYASDPERDDIPSSSTVEQSRAAVAGRAFPLFVYDPRRGVETSSRLDLTGNPEPRSTWPLFDDQPFTAADWAAREGRFYRKLRLVPKHEWHERMIPVADFFTAAHDEREAFVPYVETAGADGRAVRKTLSEDLIDFIDARLHAWRVLQEAAGLRSTLADRLRDDALAAAGAHVADERVKIQAELDEMAKQNERTADLHYRDRLAAALLDISGFGADSLKETLRTFAGLGAGHAESDTDEPEEPC